MWWELKGELWPMVAIYDWNLIKRKTFYKHYHVKKKLWLRLLFTFFDVNKAGVEGAGVELGPALTWLIRVPSLFYYLL